MIDCCGKEMRGIPQMVPPGKIMFTPSLFKGVPIAICDTCNNMLYSEGFQTKSRNKESK